MPEPTTSSLARGLGRRAARDRRLVSSAFAADRRAYPDLASQWAAYSAAYAEERAALWEVAL